MESQKTSFWLTTSQTSELALLGKEKKSMDKCPQPEVAILSISRVTRESLSKVRELPICKRSRIGTSNMSQMTSLSTV